MKINIKLRLTLYNAMVFSLLFTALFFIVYRSLEVSLIDSAKETVTESLDIIANNIAKGASIEQSSFLQGVDSGLFIRVRTTSGRPVLDSSGTKEQDGPDSLWRKALSKSSPVNGFAELSSEAPDYAAAQRMTIGGKLFIIEVAKPIGDTFDALERLRSVLLITGIAVAGLSLVGGYLLAYLALNPVETLATSAEQISSSTLGRRLEVKNKTDEIGRLAMTLNRLLSRLEHAFIRQRQFVSDAAHELATPLSSIRGHIGILKNWGSADAAVRQETIEHIDQSSQRMVVLIDELLALATLDEESVIKCQEFSVKSAIDQVVGRFAKSGQAEINVLVEKGATVSADRQRFERLIIILLDNALKYTPTAGKVVIGAERKGDRLTAYVSDTGIGIPSKDLPRIFDRFYRSDKARARKTGGSGLGLAIAKSIVEAHGGKISVESVQGEGSSIRFWLPNAHDKYSS